MGGVEGAGAQHQGDSASGLLCQTSENKNKEQDWRVLRSHDGYL